MNRLGVILSLLLWTLPVLAHKPSDSYLHLEIRSESIAGQWDIALRDLEHAIGLDKDGDGNITWGELRARHESIATYALARLEISANGVRCVNRPLTQLVDRHSDGAYTVLRFVADCPDVVERLKLKYRLFFDVDPLHRGLLRLQHRGLTQIAVFSQDRPVRQLELTKTAGWQEVMELGREGTWHIWIGYDHLLFLISLLLPAVLRREGGRWCAADRFVSAFWKVLTIVTAFTLAHTVTLSLAALGFVSLPSRWVESVIAASVVLAAFNNIYPVLCERLWIAVFAFGLLHGLGFASVLMDLLPAGSSVLSALIGFNLGVEFGQVVVVGVFFPVAYVLRKTWFYQVIVLRAGSLSIAIIASVWLAQRALDVELGL